MNAKSLTPQSGQSNAAPAANGLDGIVAVETALSQVDGQAGRLIIRGRDVEDWVRHETFDSFTPKMWAGLAELPMPLGEARALLFPDIQKRLEEAGTLSPIEKARFVLSGLPDEHTLPPHLLCLTAMALAVPAIIRLELGETPVAPDASLSTAEDFLRMVRHAKASDAEVRALDDYLVTVADHGMNASTFAARVVASTQAGVVSSVVAGLCALKGPLHGGAPGPVLDLLDELEGANDVGAAILAKLESGARLMGFGHRIYRVRDPRAEILKASVARLDIRAGRLSFAEHLESEILTSLRRWKPDRALETNVEYYTALLHEALGFPRSTFTCIFGLGRTLGWTAHAIEQEVTGRLIRPLSRYTGHLPEAA